MARDWQQSVSNIKKVFNLDVDVMFSLQAMG